MFNTNFTPNFTLVAFNQLKSDCQNQGQPTSLYSSKDLTTIAFLYAQTFLPTVPALNLNIYGVSDTVGMPVVSTYIQEIKDVTDHELSVIAM